MELTSVLTIRTEDSHATPVLNVLIFYLKKIKNIFKFKTFLNIKKFIYKFLFKNW